MQQYQHLVRTFFRLNASEKRALFEASWFMALSRASVFFISFERLMKKIGPLTEAEPRDLSQTQLEQAMLVKRSIQRTHGRLWWKNVCLPQALAAMKMLKRRRVPANLYFGSTYQKGQDRKMIAHAWVRAGDVFVTGQKGHKQHTVLSIFSHNGKL